MTDKAATPGGGLITPASPTAGRGELLRWAEMLLNIEAHPPKGVLASPAAHFGRSLQAVRQADVSILTVAARPGIYDL